MNVNNFNFKVGSHEEIKKLAKRVGEDIGDLRKLITTTREDLIAAINELKQEKSDIIGRIEVLEELHKKPADQGLAKDYPGTGWYKATDTGIVYNVGVPEGETYVFEGDPKEYISAYTKESARMHADSAATSNITDMSSMFSDAATFNTDISHWDTSNVTNMGYMFSGATAFNQPLNFDTSNVTNMISMFNGAAAFNQPLNFDTSNVTNMTYMFSNASSFNQDISLLDVGNVTNMDNMFSDATSFNGDVSSWDTSNVTRMDYMFNNATSFNGDISQWDVSNVDRMSNMFNGAKAFNQDLSQWCVSKISASPYWFDSGATSWTLPKPVWGTCPRGEDQA